MIIGLVPDAKHFKSPPYLAGQKTRKLEQDEVEKQSKDGFIEPPV